MGRRLGSPLPWLAGLLVIYLLAPVVAFLARLRGGVSAAPGVAGALSTSLITATISLAVIALLGVPLGYLLARGRGTATRLLGALVALPLALPPLMSGLLLLYVLGPETVLGRLAGGRLTETRAAIVLAQVFVSAPFLIIAARAAFAAVDPSLDEMATALGHPPLARFRRVALPVALPGISAGLMLAWLRSFGEFGATVILAYHPYSLPVFSFVQFDSSGLPATMLPVAVALAAALAVLLLAAAFAPHGLTRGRRSGCRDRLPEPGRTPPPQTPRALDFALHKSLRDFSLDISHIATTPRLALLGPSGAGKTLTLRLLAGLAANDGGQIRFGEDRLDLTPCERRGIGYVPQQPALLPRRTVWRQINFGVGADPCAGSFWLERLGLAGLEDRYPQELSGGQQRRVALARALAVRPRLLLLDEPFAGLDAPVRERLRRELRTIQLESGLSTVIVTHDPEEAAMLADDIVLLDGGRVLQSGPPREIFAAPRSPRAAGLLGIANTLRGSVSGPDTITSEDVEITTLQLGLAEGSEVLWSVRPERIRLGRNDESGYTAMLVDEVDLGSCHELRVIIGSRLKLIVRAAALDHARDGARLRLVIEPADIVVWAAGARAPQCRAAAHPPM